MNIQLEKPFEFLRRKEDNAYYEKGIVENWYKARAFVLDRLKEVAFKPTDNDNLNVFVYADHDEQHLSPLMLAVVRQIALTAHYLNFFEGNEKESPRNRTVITIVSKNPNIKKELEKEEYLCNLLKYCKYSEGDSAPQNEDSYVDLEFHFVEKWTKMETYRFTEKSVEDFCAMKINNGVDIFSIDTRIAEYAQRMYSLGADFDNLPAEDIHCAKRYSAALDVFHYKKLDGSPKKLFKDNNHSLSLCDIKEKISNILCADCFLVREKSIEKCGGENSLKGHELWANFNESLSKSEHARWVVEKLILGYRPMNTEECFHYESLRVETNGKEKQNKYQKSLKRNDKDPAHIDLCSYRELRRINPYDLKYDSFLMLAIPFILEKINKKTITKNLYNIIKNLFNKIFMKTEKYNPQPIDTSDIELPEELNSLLEAMAKNVHEIWAQERIKQGWKYGEKRDDAKKHHPCLVPYEELPEEEKVYDRNTSVETLKLILKLGFKINK